MDLKVASARATDVERAAVDALLGPAPRGRAGWCSRPRRPLPRPRRCGVARAAPPAVAHAARRQRPRRMDQPGCDQLHRRAPRRGAGRDLRRGDVLRVVLDGRATVTSGARVRRPGVPRRRRPRRARPPAGHPPVAVPRCVRAGAGRAGDRVRRSATARAVRACDTGRGAAHRRWRVARRRGTRDRRGPAGRRRRPVARAAAACRQGRPDQPRRLPGERRVRGAPPGVRHRTRPRSSARSPTPGSSAAAARRSRPGASGMPSPASPLARTTSCATPTSRSPARSRTAS